MGSWSTDVLGGDGPLDCLDRLEATLGIAELYPLATLPESSRTALAQALTSARLTALLDGCRRDPIAVQVLTTVAMAAGVALPDALRAAALEAAANDTWANEGDEGRQRSMAVFANTVRAHHAGTPSAVPHQRLFDTVAFTGNGAPQ